MFYCNWSNVLQLNFTLEQIYKLFTHGDKFGSKNKYSNQYIEKNVQRETMKWTYSNGSSTCPFYQQLT